MGFYQRYILYLLGPLASALLLQLVLLHLTQSRLRFLRWALLLPLVVPVGQVAVCCLERMFLWELGVVYYLGLALLWLSGWALAWGVHRHQKKN